MPRANRPLQPEIRVFVSSAFRDMLEEREELGHADLPPTAPPRGEPRRHLWQGRPALGRPRRATAAGKVPFRAWPKSSVCRPYFIGLLGERYGWVPEEIPEELVAAQPWLNKHRKGSVTALEILHGVLRNPAMAEHAFFYYRDPRYAASGAGFAEEDPARCGVMISAVPGIEL